MLWKMRPAGIGDALTELAKDWLYGKSNLVGIEIGSYGGESAEILLTSFAFKMFYCIDPWELHYDPNDPAGENENLFEAEAEFDRKFKNNKIVKKIKLKSSEAVSMFEDDSIDFIYIDGNHRYEFVKDDLEKYVPKIKVGGIISGHDYGGNPHTEGSKKAIDEYFRKPPIKVYADYSWIYIKE